MKLTATAEDYARAFELERQNVYPLVDAFEQRMGYAIDRQHLESAARVLACPVKKNPPCWQHGRVLYASARNYLKGQPSGCWTFLDIGTAKGFSALCLQWALNDHAGGSISSGVTSVDVIDPSARIPRNTVAEVDGPKTLAETLAVVVGDGEWSAVSFLDFVQSTGIDWLNRNSGRLHIVFVDGKHTAAVVSQEAALIAARQQLGDLCIFDDVHLPEIRAVVRGLHHSYAIEYLDILPQRGYAVAVKK